MTDRTRQLTGWARSALTDDTARIIDVIADASTRTFVRMRSSSGTYIIMDAEAETEMIEQFVKVDQRLTKAGVNVPTLYAVNPTDGFVAMTDFGKLTYHKALATESADVLYKDAIDALVTLQRFADDSDLPPYDRAFLMREMRLFRQWFLECFLGLELEPDHEARLEQCFGLLCDVAAEQTPVFVHRDYHSRNLMWVETQNPGIVDFQDAVRGPNCYDLVSLLRDVYVEWPDEFVSHWLDYYHANAVEITGDIRPAVLRRAFDLMGLQRHLKIAGLFVRLSVRDGKSGFLAAIPLTLGYIRKVCEHYPELDPLTHVLDELGVFAAARNRLPENASTSS